MVVMKFGGSSLKDPDSLLNIAEIIKKNSFSRRVVVLSAISGITDALIRAVDQALDHEATIPSSVDSIREIHYTLLKEGIGDAKIRKETIKTIDDLIGRLKKLLQGVAYTEEATARTRDVILTMGERMSVHIMTGCLIGMGVRAQAVESDQIGMIAYGEFGQGTVDQRIARSRLSKWFRPIFQSAILPVVTGFFGQTEEGDPITFGRGGSDYSAAVLTDALEAERLEVWKDVDGFLSGSPEMVTGGQLLSNLSYDEAAELSYFGAKILHPRTVEPLLERKIPIVIRNTFKPEGIGTWIGPDRYIRDSIVKSVTFDRNAAMLRLHGADVGYAVGLLSMLVNQLSRVGINIRSVMTSQTCINILLDRRDLQKAYEHIQTMKLNGIDSTEPIENISLVAIVGEGLDHAEGLVARVIHSLNQVNTHVEMIISGASKVAAYFIIQENYLKRAVQVVHETFFGKAEDF